LKIGEKKYQGFLIDADNTIFDYDLSEKEAFSETMQAIFYKGNLETAYREYRIINSSVWQKYEAGKIKADAINPERFSLLLKKMGIEVALEKITAIYLDSLSHKTYTLPHTIQTLELLSRRANLCLITNGLSYVQRNRIARTGIEIFFNSIIISEEIGCSKPAAAFFKKALETMKLPAYSVLCIGDSPCTDIKGGCQYGIDTCWFMYKQMEYPSTEPLPDYIISDLRELHKFTSQLS